MALFVNPAHPVSGIIDVLYVTSQLENAHPEYMQDDEPAVHVMTM
jgi:hypothetical protein